MKKLFIILSTMILACCCTQNKAPKVLVLYYSQTSNTKAVAEELQGKLGADIAEIVPVVAYDGDFMATIERSRKEYEDGTLPEIKPLSVDLKSYDIIFLGFPVWFGTYAVPVATVLEDPGFAGKKVVPFCTFGSGGLESSTEAIKAKLPDSEILPGYGVRAARIAAVPAEVDRFLKENGYIEGEFEPLEEFSEAHPASEEEAAVFDAAVGDYPMINAKAEEVASRPVPGGMEYRFVARDIPRDPAFEGMSGTITVYVVAPEGQAPEFTRVVR